MIRISVIIILLGIIAGLIIALSIIIIQRDEAIESRDLWHSHAMITANFRSSTDNSSYKYLTIGSSVKETTNVRK